LKLLEEASIFCSRHLPLSGRIVPGRLRRVDTPLIPPDALREILINALIHRDYTIYGANVAVALFDDRVEIWSPGCLPRGLTPQDLSRDHASVRRNPIIADVFFRAGLIESGAAGPIASLPSAASMGCGPRNSAR
jgi:ATP-dependent DNA helicase RecG